VYTSVRVFMSFRSARLISEPAFSKSSRVSYSIMDFVRNLFLNKHEARESRLIFQIRFTSLFLRLISFYIVIAFTYVVFKRTVKRSVRDLSRLYLSSFRVPKQADLP